MELSATILSTRPLSEELVQEAARAGIRIDVISFIETERVTDQLIISETRSLAHKNITAVFTSMNAVEAVAKTLDSSFNWGAEPGNDLAAFEPGRPATDSIDVNWTTFSMGFATSNLVKKYFRNSQAGTARDASELAGEIISSGVKEVVFFCGDKRRPELPEKLKAAGVNIKEIVVYKTVARDFEVATAYNGILFYSPSAVESFFSVNKINDEVVVFAIGNTTAETIRTYCNNRVIISDEPGKESLAKQAMEYFKSIRALH